MPRKSKNRNKNWSHELDRKRKQRKRRAANNAEDRKFTQIAQTDDQTAHIAKCGRLVVATALNGQSENAELFVNAANVSISKDKIRCISYELENREYLAQKSNAVKSRQSAREREKIAHRYGNVALRKIAGKIVIVRINSGKNKWFDAVKKRCENLNKKLGANIFTFFLTYSDNRINQSFIQLNKENIQNSRQKTIVFSFMSKIAKKLGSIEVEQTAPIGESINVLPITNVERQPEKPIKKLGGWNVSTESFSKFVLNKRLYS